MRLLTANEIDNESYGTDRQEQYLPMLYMLDIFLD